MPLVGIDANSKALLRTVRELLKNEHGQSGATFSDAVRFLAKECGIEVNAQFLEEELKKEKEKAEEVKKNE